MAMSGVGQLQWLPAKVNWPAMLLIAACVICGSALTYWQRILEEKTERIEHRLGQVAERQGIAVRTETPVVALTPAAVRQLREQALLLNRDWVALSNLLVPEGSDVKLLGMDVNPATGSLRITALASTRLIANAYAESLASRGQQLQQVRLMGLEQRPDGIRFEVSAQWSK